ncbi:nickel pincer cofactor biosynthesis protein LarC [Parablautia intestinalis]|uniref:nickel pincer cofactor biosynthesis protein LarC n=1 Tax=Parablautia intestinalis TaxID=2320100 RepID=UPI00256ED5D9|nr:nickel pincer cofactor biosynthesis protein LarC [Parablautia intestinalis]
MGNTLYLECYAGISGDMTVAALLDAGADKEVLDKALKSLPIHGYEIEISRVKKAGLDVCDFNVRLDAEHENHDHDMEYLHGHAHPHDENCPKDTACEHEHTHSHEHVHSHEEHHHPHIHRGLKEIIEIIRQGQLTERAKETAVKIFHILAQAEAKAHGVPMEEVHFHEVGAVDSIVDIVAAAVCLDNLDITEVIVPFLCEGRGTVRCQHGILPVPVPAVANIVEEYQLPVRLTDIEGELVTPTGGAIVAAARTGSRLPAQFTVNKIGIGAGKRNYERPSLLRAMLITQKSAWQTDGLKEDLKRADCIYKLETNIDDCTGESLGHTMDKLMAAGARDVHFIPVFMKKSRPAYELAVICDEERIKELELIIFQETTTIGIRRVRMERTLLPRKKDVVTLPEGELKVKRCVLPDGQERCYPEYESMVALAEKSGKTFWQIMNAFKQTKENS